MTLKIRPVETSKDLQRFIMFPHKLYMDCPWWVPNLISDDRKLLTPGKHPFHEHADVRLFLAEDGNRVVGRISAHVNHQHNEFHADRKGFFGFFESIESDDVASALFEAAENYLREKSMDSTCGPMNFSTNETCGLLIHPYDEMPYIMMPYNYPYYQKLLENAGYVMEKDLISYHLDEEIFSFERIGKVAERIQKRSKVSLRQVDFKNMDREIQIIRDIYNSAWEKNWGFVPMTDAEFELMAKEMKTIVDPRLLYIGMFEDKPVGFILCLPDFNIVLKKMNGRLFPFGILKALWYKRKIDRIRIITLGVVQEFRRAGLDILFYSKIANISPSIGYPRGELGWVLEDNVLMNRAAKTMGAKPTKRYRIYHKKL